MFLQKKKLITCLALLLPFLFMHKMQAQTGLIQLSGIVSDDQTLAPVAFAQVRVPAGRQYAYASEVGFFSLVVSPGDTIEFSALGFKPKYYAIPDTGYDEIASIAVFLSKDTMTLDAVEIYPWPSKEDFREAFLAYQEIKDEIQPIPGIKGRDEIDTVPKPPSPIMNPISFIYDEVVKPIQWQKRKRKMVDKLPAWDDEK